MWAGHTLEEIFTGVHVRMRVAPTSLRREVLRRPASGHAGVVWPRASQPKVPAAAREVYLPMVRMPTTLFPTQRVSLQLVDPPADDSAVRGADSSFFLSRQRLPMELAEQLWREHGGRVAALGPCGTVGVELRLLDDRLLEQPLPPSSDDARGGAVAHAICGRRLRLIDQWAQPADGLNLARLESVADDVPRGSRAERLQDEATRAKELMSLVASRRMLELNDEIAAAVCDPRAHPLWRPALRPPAQAEALSFWLAARLPLTAGLRASLLQATCPLRRLQDTVDAMRMLLQAAPIGPQPRPARFSHRFSLLAMPPAEGGAGADVAGAVTWPRHIVGEAVPAVPAAPRGA